MIQHANVIIQKTIALSSQLNGSLSPRRLLDPSFLFTALSTLILSRNLIRNFQCKSSFFHSTLRNIYSCFFFYGKIISCAFQFVHWKIFLLKDAAFFIVASSSRQNKIKRFFFFDRLIKENDEALTHPICTAKKDFQSLLITQMP